MHVHAEGSEEVSEIFKRCPMWRLYYITAFLKIMFNANQCEKKMECFFKISELHSNSYVFKQKH